MKRKAILLLVSLLAVSSMSACSGSGNVVSASSYVDYSFEEYTDPPTEPPTEPTEAPTEKPTEKKKEKASETIVNNKQQKSETATEKPTEKKEAATQKTTQQEQKQPANDSDQSNSSSQVEVGSFADEDVSVIYDNRILTLDTEFNVVKATLGEPESTVEYPNSKLTDNGEAYIYKYNNMKVYTYMKENVEYVESVRVEDDGNATTSKGVDAGNSTTDVKAKYGEPSSGDSTTLKYNSEDKELVFYIHNDVVTSFAITRN